MTNRNEKSLEQTLDQKYPFDFKNPSRVVERLREVNQKLETYGRSGTRGGDEEYKLLQREGGFLERRLEEYRLMKAPYIESENECGARWTIYPEDD